jgi:hypothetical protein
VATGFHDPREDATIDLTRADTRYGSRKLLAQWTITPTGESDNKGHPCYAVCVFDGDVRGVQISSAVIELAREHGWSRGYAIHEDDIDFAVDEAEDYLNSLTPAGYQFGFDDGSFFLANDAWWSMVNE